MRGDLLKCRRSRAEHSTSSFRSPITQEAGGLSGCAMTMLLDDGVRERHATWTVSGPSRERDGGADRIGSAFRPKFGGDR
jgi:hypothetical protein